MKKGIYAIKGSGKIYLFYKVRTFEDAKNKFYICSIETSSGKFEKVLISKKSEKYFVKIGNL